ncbi:hypothetical protein F0266_10565 [Vibrio coralliilyticus]|uniref:hypothetical protein n=1 Tax=Vibrio coralliilyticus TaxID=190893 RepID=UPI00148E3699|nr:hypothetical protein [Vibrio coralliilyticus]NOH53376.1 hypothetical protein [Vibrio coralliilyticus]
MSEGLFLSAHSDVSGRYAILGKDEQSGVLYLTQSGTQKNSVSCLSRPSQVASGPYPALDAFHIESRW